MRIAIAGGTGLVGTRVVLALRDAGHEPVVLARSRGVDITTGTGLDAALTGVEAVIDVSNVTTARRVRSVSFFAAGTGRLLAAGHRAGVRQHVALSIVGVDRVDFGYYAGKRRQEALVLAGPVPGSVLRATQFHEFPGQLLMRSRGPLALMPRMRIQPVAAREVAAELVALAGGPAQGMAPELAGPQVHELGDLARLLLRARGQHRHVVEVRLPGAAGRAAAGGALLPTGPGPRSGLTFEQWLTADQLHRSPAGVDPDRIGRPRDTRITVSSRRAPARPPGRHRTPPGRRPAPRAQGPARPRRWPIPGWSPPTCAWSTARLGRAGRTRG